MTDEEMAEQFADNISGLELTCSVLASKDKNHAYRLGRYDGFLAGLKAGRQWHDLRKNKNLVPDSPRLVLVKCIDSINCEFSYYIDNSWILNRNVPVIAWCELPTFDKE